MKSYACNTVCHIDERVVSGVVVVEVAIACRKWTLVRRMFEDLAIVFGDCVWDGTLHNLS